MKFDDREKYTLEYFIKSNVITPIQSLNYTLNAASTNTFVRTINNENRDRFGFNMRCAFVKNKLLDIKFGKTALLLNDIVSSTDIAGSNI